MLIPAKL